MKYLMNDYDEALYQILYYGDKKPTRTGIDTLWLAGIQSRYELFHAEANGFRFPIVTGRKMNPAGVWGELLWMISGSTLNQDAVKLGCKFWTPWCEGEKYEALRKRWGYRSGDFGPIYGWQLRHYGADYIDYSFYRDLADETENTEQKATFQKAANNALMGGFDQLARMVHLLKHDPNSRRNLFVLWNPKDEEKMALPPCHYSYQVLVGTDKSLTGILTQRSCDFPIGVPANIQFYSALTIMLAQQAGLWAKELIHETHDSHIYVNQIDAVKEYLDRRKPASPVLNINPAATIDDYKPEDFVVTNYFPCEPIKIPVAV
jgi:thymidylate synthase